TVYDGQNLAGEGVPLVIKVVNSIGLTAAVTNVDLIASPLAGMYRVSYDFIVTAAGNAVNLAGIISWNNGAAAKSITTANIACNTLGASSSLIGQPGSIVFYSAAANNITYSTTLSGGIGSGQYAVRIRLEYLG